MSSVSSTTGLTTPLPVQSFSLLSGPTDATAAFSLPGQDATSGSASSAALAASAGGASAQSIAQAQSGLLSIQEQFGVDPPGSGSTGPAHGRHGRHHHGGGQPGQSAGAAGTATAVTRTGTTATGAMSGTAAIGSGLASWLSAQAGGQAA